MAHETATLAGYVADLKFTDIPREVLERAKVLTLDFLGSTIRARRDAESTPSLLKMLEALALDGKGHSTVFGDAKTWTPAVAALLNGALGHSLDFDDTVAGLDSRALSRSTGHRRDDYRPPVTNIGLNSDARVIAARHFVQTSELVRGQERRVRIFELVKHSVDCLAIQSRRGNRIHVVSLDPQKHLIEQALRLSRCRT